MRFKRVAMSVALAGVLTGCRANTINLVYFAEQGKVVLYPKQGDVLVWKDQAGQPLTSVQFPLGGPCKSEDEIKKGQCTIAVPDPSQIYKIPYTCKECADPEIVVGSDSSILNNLRATAVPTGLVQMGCNTNQVKLFLEETVIPQATVTAGSATVQWTRAGNPAIGVDWTTDDLSSICSNGPTFNNGNDTCTLKKDAVTTSYKVSAASCNNTSKTGTIKIM